nr:MAG TPA: hypothetical protein [Caudoviricetes sp.]
MLGERKLLDISKNLPSPEPYRGGGFYTLILAHNILFVNLIFVSIIFML